MKFTTTLLLLMLALAGFSQRPLFFEAQIQLEDSVEADPADVKVFVLFDNRQMSLEPSKKGEIGFRFYPQTDYTVVFALEGFVTKTMDVNLADLDFNMKKRDLNYRDYTVTLEKRKKHDGFKIYTQPVLTFQYQEEVVNDTLYYAIEQVIDSSYTYVDFDNRQASIDVIRDEVDEACFPVFKYTKKLRKLRIREEWLSENPEYRNQI